MLFRSHKSFIRSLGTNRVFAIREITFNARQWMTLALALRELGWRLENLQTIRLFIRDNSDWSFNTGFTLSEYRVETPGLFAAVWNLPDAVKEIKVLAIGDQGLSTAHPPSSSKIFAAAAEERLREKMREVKKFWTME